MERKRELTEQQQKVLDVLFEEAGGNIRAAMRLAGYSESTPSSVIINSLNEEIVELCKKQIAANGPQAVLALLGVLNDPAAMGAQNKLKAAEQILNRAGITKKEDNQDVNLKVPAGGLFILPAKSKDIESEKESKDEE